MNDDNQVEVGIFHALAFIRDHHSTQDEDRRKLKGITGWFNTYLEKPTMFSNAKNKNPAAISLSWYKDSAKEHIRKMHEVISILVKYELIVEIVTTKNPGYIVFEDEHQVSAVPFRKDVQMVL
jgi:hypothetical protein